MARRGEIFAGLSVAIVTPFKASGEIDEAALRNIVEFHIDSGTDCVCPVGTTGESPTLSHEEHEQVIKLTCEAAAGRIKVMAGTGSNSTAEAIRLTQFAKDVWVHRFASGRSVLQQAQLRKVFSSTSRRLPSQSTFRWCFTTSPAEQRRILRRKRLPASPRHVHQWLRSKKRQARWIRRRRFFPSAT